MVKAALISAAFAAVVAIASTAVIYESRVIPERVAIAARQAAEAATDAAEERAAMLAQAAAAEAIAGELRRRQAAIGAALASHQSQAIAEAAELAARLEQVEAERTRYAQELRAAGRSCPYDLAIERYLGGVPLGNHGPALDGNGLGGGAGSRVNGLN